MSVLFCDKGPTITALVNVAVIVAADVLSPTHPTRLTSSAMAVLLRRLHSQATKNECVERRGLTALTVITRTKNSQPTRQPQRSEKGRRQQHHFFATASVQTKDCHHGQVCLRRSRSSCHRCVDCELCSIW